MQGVYAQLLFHITPQTEITALLWEMTLSPFSEA